MPDTSHPRNNRRDIAAASKRRDRKPWQVGLRTLFLLIAATGVWTTFFINRRYNASLEARIRATLPLAHELVIDDAQQIAIVKLEEFWFDENRWDIYLPEGRYRLCIATREIDEKELAPEAKSAPIMGGRHQLGLEQHRDKDSWRVEVKLDGTPLLVVEEPKEWNPGSGSTGGAQFSSTEQLPANKGAVLFRRRFMHQEMSGAMATPKGPTEGILLWIERLAGPKPER
jgi:hypothetical protein